MKKISKQQVKDWVKKYKTEIALGVVGVVTAGATALIMRNNVKIDQKNALQDVVYPGPDDEIFTLKVYNGEGELQGETQVYQSYAEDLLE